MTTEERLVEYVRLALERRESGESVDIEGLCDDHPELTDAVREALQLQDTIDLDLDADPLIDEILNDRYELLECIGTGAMGAVYRAGDRTLGREVAVKILQPGILNGADRRKRFVREAQVLASLEHPGIVAIFDHGHTATGLSFLVMPRLIGVPMSAIILDAEDRERGPDGSIALPSSRALTERFGIDCQLDFIPQVATWFADLAQALSAAHGARVFHRDVKPSNIFVTKAGAAVLIDFGIAARVDDVTLTAAGSTLGTPWYMSPEQAEQRETATPQVDVYGMCATMYHLLAMRPPYDGMSAEVLAQLKKQDPPPLKSLRRSLPTDLSAIVEKGLERDPRDRYADMAAFEADLRGFLEGRPIVARPLSRTTRLIRRVRRRPLPLALTLLVLLSVVAAVWTTSYLHDRELARERQHRTGVAGLSPSLALEGTLQSRLEIPAAETREMLKRLTALLELKPDDVDTRLLRLALRQDAGLSEASSDDLAALAGGHPTPYLAALQRRYAKIAPGARGVGVLNLTDLPAPTTDLGRTVAAFHLLRTKQPLAAYELLGQASDYLPARYLRLNPLLDVAFKAKDEAKREIIRSARDELQALQEEIGETARIQHTLGTLLAESGDREGALQPLRRAIELTEERSYGPLFNYSHSCLVLDQLEEAEAAIEKARALRPGKLNALILLAQIRTAQGDYAAAMAVADALPEQGDLLEPWQRPYLKGHVAYWQHTHLIGARRPAEAKQVATRSIGYFEDCLAKLPGTEATVHRQLQRNIARARLYLSDDPLYFAHLLVLIRQSPLDRYNLRTLATLLETQPLTPTTQALFKKIVEAQYTARAGTHAPKNKKHTNPR